ncbi:MAG: hypothetical protein IPP58_04645 [Holophagaceae bacterium]|uniref:Uncharacterized protein n=1 Tax=Candidatus Geothrix skivensis TaxID=2954439 RepID=A0A9D7SDU0_9BACT|nr:hypothetical protein [Candidatus Geothrix skivensis]
MRQPAPADRYDLGFGAGGALVKDLYFYFVDLAWDRQRERPYPDRSGLQGDDKDTATTQAIIKLNGYPPGGSGAGILERPSTGAPQNNARRPNWTRRPCSQPEGWP